MTLRLEESSHTYFLDGLKVPSVTEVLLPLQSFEGIPWDVLEQARIFGQHVHQACALLVRNQLDWASLDPKLVPYVEGAQRFLKDTGFVVLRSEWTVHNESLRVAGTLDLLGKLGDAYTLVDWKSTDRAPSTVGYQLAGYEGLYRNQFGGQPMKRLCVILTPGYYRLHPQADKRDWNAFVSCLNFWHLRARHCK